MKANLYPETGKPLTLLEKRPNIDRTVVKKPVIFTTRRVGKVDAQIPYDIRILIAC
jgi:hypothetical protein